MDVTQHNGAYGRVLYSRLGIYSIIHYQYLSIGYTMLYHHLSIVFFSSIFQLIWQMCRIGPIVTSRTSLSCPGTSPHSPGSGFGYCGSCLNSLDFFCFWNGKDSSANQSISSAQDLELDLASTCECWTKNFAASILPKTVLRILCAEKAAAVWDCGSPTILE